MSLFTIRRALGWRLLDAVGGEGGAGGGAGGGEPAATQAEPPKDGGDGGAGGEPTPPPSEPPKEGGGEQTGTPGEPAKTEPGPRSAFARFAERAKGADGRSGDGKPGEPAKTEPGAVDLSKMSDEDWAKAVQPTGEDGTEPDRSLMLGMAQVARECGVTPDVMRRLSARFDEIERGRAAERDAILLRDQQELAAKAEAAFDDSAMADIMAASAKYIRPDGMLASAMRDTVLGSDIELLTILRNLGSTLRSDTPPTTAAAGSSQSADHRLFMRTVPERLRQ